MKDRVSDRLRWIDYPPGERRGEDVVLLHGLGSSSGDWLLQAPIFQDRHRVVAIDLPGFGESPRLPGWPSIADYARSVSRAMVEAEIPAAHLVGLSLGGSVALQFGIDFPAQARSLTLVNSFARLRVRPVAMLRTGVRFLYVLMGRMDRVGAWVAQELFPDPRQAELRSYAAGRLAHSGRFSYLQAGQALARFNVGRRLEQVRCPTLIVAGDDDTTIPLSAKLEMARRIPGARLARIPRSGHATPIDEAQAFNELVEQFLEEVDRRLAGGSTAAGEAHPAEHAT